MSKIDKVEELPLDSGNEQTVESDDKRTRYEKILDESIARLVESSKTLDKLIEENKGGSHKTMTALVNSRARVQQELVYTILVSMNPKLKLTPDSLRDKDLARLIQMSVEEDEENSEEKPPDQESVPQTPPLQVKF